MSPILWADSEIDELLAGSSAQSEARTRKAALAKQWQDLDSRFFSQDRTRYPPSEWKPHM